MSNPISYSLLNSYNYDNKPSINGWGDFFSAPARWILGGKSVQVTVSLNESQPASTIFRIGLVASAIIFRPLAKIFVAGLALKCIVSLIFQEKTKIEQAMADKVAGEKRILDLARDFLKRENTDLSIVWNNPDVYRNYSDVQEKVHNLLVAQIPALSWIDLKAWTLRIPGIIQNPSIQRAIALEIDKEMAKDNFWSSPGLLVGFSLFSYDKQRVNACFKKRIERTLAQFNGSPEAKKELIPQFLQFIQGLGHHNLVDMETICEGLIQDSLKIEQSDSGQIVSYKLLIIDSLIAHLFTRRIEDIPEDGSVASFAKSVTLTQNIGMYKMFGTYNKEDSKVKYQALPSNIAGSIMQRFDVYGRHWPVNYNWADKKMGR